MIKVIVLVLCLVVLFIAGYKVGETKKEKGYFDEYPSPLACHRDGTCGVKPCNLSEYKGTPLCQ